MLKMIYLKSKTFVAEEAVSAMKQHESILPVTIEVPRTPDQSSASIILEKLKPHLPACIFSVDNAGYDKKGTLVHEFIKSGSLILNWYTDDPVLSGFLWPKNIYPIKNRIDFVTEKTWVNDLESKGYQSVFLPLAADPEIFNPEKYSGEYLQDIAFTGSSSLEFMDFFLSKRIGMEVEKRIGIVNRMRKLYSNNPGIDLKSFLEENSEEWIKGLESDPELFKNAAIWMVGYLHRKDFIVSVSKKYRDRFVCFGDINWKKFIADSKVTTEACYYTNLCSTYRSTKINININRIQVRTSFNQRIFDIPASGAFLLNEKREMNGNFFNTSGNDKDLAEFSSKKDFHDKVNYFLKHDKEREEIAQRGMKRVLSYHTYLHRFNRIIEEVKRLAGI